MTIPQTTKKEYQMMKTLIICMFCVCALSAFAATPRKVDEIVIKRWKDTLVDQKKTPGQKIKADVCLQIIEKKIEINSFEDLKKICNENIVKYQGLKAEYVYAVVAVELYKHEPSICGKEFFDICKRNCYEGVAYPVIITMKNDADKFDKCVEFLPMAKVDRAKQSVFLRLIDSFIKLCPSIEESKAKAALKLLNRQYSPYLISDKTAWEPVIAKIRTTLEAY